MNSLPGWISLYSFVFCFIIVCSGEHTEIKTNHVPETEAEPRIAGGINAYKGQFPWIVSIQVTNFEVGYHLCGGTLLTPEWVLTAAHCLDSEKPEWLWVVTGEYDMSVEEGTEQRLTVDSFIQHPEYAHWERPYTNDVGMIHLSKRPVMDNYTMVAPVPFHTLVTFADPCYEAGWGSTSSSGLGSDVLQYVSVSLLDSSVCLNAYSSFPEGQICGGNIGGGAGFCVGDNGGPLHCKERETGRYVVAGTISWRDGCAKPDLPGVYMNNAYYGHWIYNVITGSK